MKNTLKCKHPLWTWTIIGFMVSIFGCNESLKTLDADKIEKLKPQAVQIINNSLADENPRIRARAIEVVAETGQIQFMPTVQQLLKDRSMPVVFNAIMAVGETEYRPAERSIKQLLKDRDQNIRIAAAYALKKLGSSQNFKLLKDAISSKNQTVRANAAMLLGRSGDKNTLELLYWAMSDKDSDENTRFQVVEAIARLGDERILQDKLWAIAFSSYTDDRITAIIAMGALGSQKAKDVLITKLDDDVLEVRLAAAEQLGALGDTTGEPEVLDIFRKNPTERMSEKDLERFNILKKLIYGMDDKNLERINILTALAIGSIATDKLIAFLPDLLENKSQFVRIAAAKAAFQCTGNR